MKKVYLSMFIIGLGSNLSFGQYATKPITSNEMSKVAPKEMNVAPVAKALGTQFWIDDFSAPATWAIDNSGQPGGAFGWTVDAVNDGWWSGSPINSTSDGNYAELSNGDAQAATQALNVVYTMTTANPIDLASSGTNITLDFLQFGARFNDLQEIQVSVDGTNFIVVGDNNDMPVLSASGGAPYTNPSLKSINLASYIAGATQIWIRFSWTTNYPASASNPNVWITYGWYIDDVSLTTNAEYDLDVTSTYWGTAGLNYYQIPLTQVAPIDFSANVMNGGTLSMTNATLNVDINSGAYTGTSASATIPSLTMDSLFVTVPFTPAANGTYNVTRTITTAIADDVPTNNAMAPISFTVNNYIYARDNNVVAGSTSNGATDGFEAGNLFDIWADQTCQGLNVRLAGGAGQTAVGTEIYAKIYSIDPTTGDFVFAGESLPLIVAASNLNTNLLMTMIDPVDLLANNTYLAVVGSYTPGLAVANAGTSEPQTSFFLDAADGTWYYQTSTPYVRFNFDPSLAVDENQSAISIGNVFPNPTSGETTINYSLANASNVNIDVVDITGKIVYSMNNGTEVEGSHKVSFNAASFSNGVYYVTISTDEATVTKKFIKK
jgi:hypothetical protein